MQNWNELIFSEQPFEAKAYKIFSHQFKHNPVYQRFCSALEISPDSVDESIRNIPLLPVRAYKEAKITCQPDTEPDLIFQSSGTGGMDCSTHQVADADLYRKSIMKGFNHFYNLGNTVILAYTPGYAENPHSSLIWMLNELINQDQINKSRFLPLNKPINMGEVNDIAASGKQLVLFGAAFGLLDLVEISSVTLPSNSIVIETGGMKTHRREIDRQQMHRRLAGGFGIDISRIHSEYGMCELLSQAYATGGKWFRSVPWMRVTIRDPENPQRELAAYREGLIGVVDLANVHSCSFLLTGDRGIMDPKGRFQVLGRWHPDDLRGCNFLIDED